MPEPNLPPLHIGIGPIERGCVHVDDLKKIIPEMPDEIRERLIRENGLTLEQSIRLVVFLTNGNINKKIYSYLFSE